MNAMRDRRVLVTDGEARWVLAAARGLNAAGYRVSVAASSDDAITHRSRACDEAIVVPDPHRDAAGFVAAVATHLEERADRPALLPGNEASLRAISEHRSLIAGTCLLSIPPHPVVEAALNKAATLAAADDAGIASPASTICTSVADGRDAALTYGYPVMVKPARSQLAWSGGLRGQTSVLVRRAPDLEQAATSMGIPFLVQRYRSDARVLSVGGVAADGHLLAAAVGRYVRTWPARAGSASCSETIEPPTGLLDAVHRFLVAMAWSGVFELELLETPTERSLIDFNPRLYGSISLAIAAGANLPAIWCDHLLGRERPFVLARPGHRYRFEAAEANNLLAHLRAGRWREAARVARPKRGVTHAIFSLDDPAPFAADLRRRTRKERVAAPRSGATVGAGR